MKRKDILDAATQAVCSDRNETYGEPEDSFGLIAAYWSTHLDTKVTATDVGVMMTLFKLARAKANPAHTDSFVDAAGYAACAGEIGAWVYPASAALCEGCGKPCDGTSEYRGKPICDSCAAQL